MWVLDILCCLFNHLVLHQHTMYLNYVVFFIVQRVLMDIGAEDGQREDGWIV